jgi:hypothetical protein
MSIFKPKNPAQMAAQLSSPAPIVLGDGRHGAGVVTGSVAEAGRSPVDLSFVFMRLLDGDRLAQRLRSSFIDRLHPAFIRD